MSESAQAQRLLTVVRHAKSDWSNDLADSLRPLNSRGLRNAPAVAAWFAKQHPEPDWWVSSPALRAYHTAFAFRRAYHPTPDDGLQLDSRLYEADTLNWLQVLGSIPADKQHAIAFGHNPGIAHLLNYLCPSELREVVTCTVLVMALHIPDWSAISPDCGRLLTYASPETLGVR